MYNELHIITVISNPCKYKSRYRLYRNFKKHIEQSGGKLYTVELVGLKDKFVVTSKNNPCHLQIRSDNILWHKENMINMGVEKLFPKNWKYMAWVDADIEFLNPCWIKESVEKLKKHDIIQLFHTGFDLGPQYQPIGYFRSFCAGQEGACFYDVNVTKNNQFHPGFAWGMTRKMWDKLGGLIDICVVGSADYHMAMALVGKISTSFMQEKKQYQYCADVEKWAKPLDNNVSIGYTNGTLMHFWHGKKKNRGYGNRREMLRDHDFNPCVDLWRRKDGLIVFSGNKPKLQADILEYFSSRDEDSMEL